MALTEHHADVPREPDRDPVLARVYAESARDEPPAARDDAIRAAARREVGAGPRSLRARLRSWRMPVSIAAILVLSASLVMLMKEEGADEFYQGPVPDAARTHQYYEPPPASAPTPTPKEMPEGLLSAPAAPAAPTAKGDGRIEQPKDRGRDMKRQVESVLDRAQPSAIPPAAPAEERQPAAPLAKAPQPFPQREGSVGEADKGSTQAGSVAGFARGDDVSRRQRAADVGTGALLERREARSAAQEVVQPPPAPAPAAKASGPLNAAAPAPIWSGFERQPPEKWVERIEELRRAGRETEAREMLGEFRKRFPGYALPAALSR